VNYTLASLAGGVNQRVQLLFPGVNLASRSFIFSCWLRADDDSVGKGIRLRVARILGTSLFSDKIITLTGTWARYSTDVLTGLSDTVGIYGGLATANAYDPFTFQVAGTQVEEVTGQADQTPSEYVSTNVLSYPYHGAGVDGVKYFSTRKDGTLIPDSQITLLKGPADSLSYTSAPISDTQGTALIDIEAADWASVAGQYLGDGTEAVMKASTANKGVQAFDGTNTASGPSGTPSGRMKFAVTWGNGQMQCFANGQAGAVQSYDGSFNLDSFIVGSGFEGGMRNLRLFKSRLPTAKIQRLTS
jgi:hypothetical protein